MAVGPSGQVDWVVNDVHPSAIQDTLAAHGCLDVELVSLETGQFLMPGFIDTHTVCFYELGAQLGLIDVPHPH